MGYRRYRIEIFPSDYQKPIIQRTIGLYRYVYNWGIIRCKEDYKNGQKVILKSDLFKKFSEARNSSEFLGMIDLHTGRCALKALFEAYRRFFKKIAGYPRFKTKKHTSKSFQVRNDPNAFYFRDNYVKIPGIEGMVYCKNHNIPKGQYYAPTVLFDGYRYWLFVSVKYEDITPDTSLLTDESIGIDLGFRKTMQLSNGMSYTYPDLHKLERRKRKLQRNLDKRRAARVRESIRTKTKYEDLPISKNEEKIKYQFYKTQQRMNNIRNSFAHQSTTEIVNLYPKRIVVEDLNIQGILGIKAMRKMHDGVAFTRLLHNLKYKCEERRIEFVKAPRFFASSQICSNCGEKHKVGSKETFVCPYCGFTIDRDLNAAINLSRVGC